MRIVFDQGTPVPLRESLVGHEVITAYELGWSMLTNGDLLRAAEAMRFDVMVTTDRNLRYQQNLGQRRIAIVVLGTTSWPRIRAGVAAVVAAVDSVRPGSYAEVPIP